ncbi:hypothetical protein AMTR_s00047p00138210 [Amborella trichopoda]|uniref:Disease resistance protein Roq1-like winged-helix domain-containing protein n=1 Tax=Amborella trichopoda TaxID=13333 RepID=U5D8M1_AMBTC|nr:hypothetical protein AMTR_s00047p00138210 [Amborella trichopoda]
MQEHAKFSKDMVSTAGGLPLALEVLGSHLWDKTTIDEWEDAVKKLKRIPEDDITLKLRISYDNLNEEEKHIFLDIACFFIGETKDYTIDIWKGCGFPASISIKKLLQRSLMKIDVKDRLQMHDQLRDMGRWIVELENLCDPGRHRRLWSEEHVINVFKYLKGIYKVRGLMLVGNEREVSWETEAFKPMTNLKLLSINRASLVGNFRYLSSELVWLQWPRCPLPYLPNDFSHEELAVLDLSYSEAVLHLSNNNIKQLFPKFKVLDLSYCHNLERISDCSLYPNLEKLNLVGCCKLVEIPDFIGLLKNLFNLNLGGFDNLKELPNSLGSLVNLKGLNVSGCKGLCSLEELNAKYCDLQGMIPDDFEKFSSLKKFNISHNNIQGLPSGMKGLSQLETLSIRYCE